MKTVLVLRHAKSSWSNENLADHDRPLNSRGKHDAPRMGAFIASNDLVPDLIISSSAKRAIATAKLAADSAGYDQGIRVTRNLYHASPEEYFEELVGVKDSYDRVMLVGHNPGMEELVEVLTGSSVRMPTAALAQIELRIVRWSDLGEDVDGRLVNLWYPKDLI